MWLSSAGCLGAPPFPGSVEGVPEPLCPQPLLPLGRRSPVSEGLGTPFRGSPCEEVAVGVGRRDGEGLKEQAAFSLPPCTVAQAINCLSSGCLPEPHAEACYLNFKITFFF